MLFYFLSTTAHDSIQAMVVYLRQLLFSYLQLSHTPLTCLFYSYIYIFNILHVDSMLNINIHNFCFFPS